MARSDRQLSVVKFVEQLMDFLEQKHDWLRNTLSRDEWNALCETLHEFQKLVSEDMSLENTVLVIDGIYARLTVNSQVERAVVGVGSSVGGFLSLEIVLRGSARIRDSKRVARVLSNRLPHLTELYQPLDADSSSDDGKQHPKSERSRNSESR